MTCSRCRFIKYLSFPQRQEFTGSALCLAGILLTHIPKLQGSLHCDKLIAESKRWRRVLLGVATTHHLTGH